MTCNVYTAPVLPFLHLRMPQQQFEVTLERAGLSMHKAVLQNQPGRFDLFFKALLHGFCLDFLVNMI